MLMRFGLEVGGCPEEVSGDVIKRIHIAYIDAGARFVTTNTFGGSRTKLDKYGLGDKVSEINRRNTRLAVEAASGNGTFVAGDIGPTGEFIEPYGEFTMDRFIEVFSEQARALEQGGADLIIIETMAAIEETVAALKAARTSTSLPVIACMTFNRNPGGEYRTMMGVSPDQFVSTLSNEGADVLGTNCSLTPPDIIDLADELRNLTELPLLVQPNAGAPRLEDGRTVYDPIPDLEGCLKRIIATGVDMVGGCCGTDPEYIRLLKRLLEEAGRESDSS